jgi:hypothetical protein
MEQKVNPQKDSGMQVEHERENKMRKETGHENDLANIDRRLDGPNRPAE